MFEAKPKVKIRWRKIPKVMDYTRQENLEIDKYEKLSQTQSFM